MHTTSEDIANHEHHPPALADPLPPLAYRNHPRGAPTQNTAQELARAVTAADAQLMSTPDQSVHLWALVCLLRAAEASGAYLSRCSGGAVGAGGGGGGGGGAGVGSLGSSALSAAWRAAWGTLLRADLRFSNPTLRCERGGVGEAVVAVLGACMRERLVEPGLVTKEQVSVCTGSVPVLALLPQFIACVLYIYLV